MLFDQEIESVRSDLKKAGDVRFETMRLLTESHDKDGLKDLQKMWATVKKYSLKRPPRHASKNQWVYNFLGAAYSASKLPPYFYYSGEKRTKLIEEINRISNRLKTKFVAYDLGGKLEYSGKDVLSLLRDYPNSNGFYILEDISPEFDRDYEDHSHPAEKDLSADKMGRLSLPEALGLFVEMAERQIKIASQKGYAGERARVTRFVRILIDKNKRRYGKPLNDVASKAVFAIYGLEYSASDISNLINR